MPVDPPILSETFAEYADAITKEYGAMAQSAPLEIPYGEFAHDKQQGTRSKIRRTVAQLKARRVFRFREFRRPILNVI